MESTSENTTMMFDVFARSQQQLFAEWSKAIETFGGGDSYAIGLGDMNGDDLLDAVVGNDGLNALIDAPLDVHGIAAGSNQS